MVVTRHWKIEILVYTSSCETTLPSLSIKGVGCAPHTLVDVHQCNGDGVEGGTKESSKAVSKMLRSKWLVGTCVCVCAYTEDHLLHNQRRAHNNIVHHTPD